jgi:hypothetical protein
MREETSGVYKMERISWLAEELLASKEGLCSVEFVEIVGCWLVG